MVKDGTKPLIAIVGPTASGKSALALKLAKEFQGYIISADSRQVYRGLDIGTAKPTRAEQRRVRHFGIDIIDPNETYSAARFQRLVRAILKRESGLPFLVGGTGLYIDAVLQNWDMPKKPSAALRNKLNDTALASLVKRLRSIDPERTLTVDLHNKRRVIRALEIAIQSRADKRTKRQKSPFPYRTLVIGVAVPREILVKRIDARVDAMMRRGLLKEVGVLAKRYGRRAPAMYGLGYRQLIAYLHGRMTKEAAVERIKIETRQYAKRQLTWFRRNTDIRWISTSAQAEQLVRALLKSNSPAH